mgnify:CR=1 FL=1
MTTSIFASILSSGTLTAGQFFLLFAAAIALGLIIAALDTAIVFGLHFVM